MAQDAKKNTEMLLHLYRPMPDEYAMLHGVLCASHALDREGQNLFDTPYDSMMIARRMDEINAGASAQIKG